MVRLDIKLLGHLLVGGGQTSNANLATIRRLENGRGTPYIPATAIRGAIRIQLESLLRGLKGSATGPYPFEEPGDNAPTPDDDAAARLFGYSGPPGERSNSKHGQLRFSDALPEDPRSASLSVAVRTGVEINDYTGTAEDKKLFSREVVEISEKPLLFHCWMDTGCATKEDLQRLRAAVETTHSVGGNQSSGGGEIEIDWVETEAPKRTVVLGDTTEARRARLMMELLEPAHFGDGGPFGNHHATKSYVPGSTVRGAIAWALLRSGRCQATDDAFQQMFVAARRPVSFGDALPVDDGAAEPRLNPITFRKPRVRGGSGVDVLRRELAREIVNEELKARGLYLRADWKRIRSDPEPARRTERVVRRTRTRVSLDRHSGTAAEGKLFSIEQIEPWQTPEVATGAAPPTVFVSWIESLNPLTAELLSRLDGLPLMIGAGRHHGMGLVKTLLRFEQEPVSVAPENEVTTFRDALNLELEALATQLQIDPSALLWRDTVPLALMAVSDFIATSDTQHPLSEFEPMVGTPWRRFLKGGAVGGYDQLQESNGAKSPLKNLIPTVAAGSVFVYRVAQKPLMDLLPEALRILRRGVGAGLRNGRGRFALYQESPK